MNTTADLFLATVGFGNAEGIARVAIDIQPEETVLTVEATVLQMQSEEHVSKAERAAIEAAQDIVGHPNFKYDTYKNEHMLGLDLTMVTLVAKIPRHRRSAEKEGD